jgi:hypothetical protein
VEIHVNGKASAKAPLTLIVAPLHEIPQLPEGYYEVSRWADGTGTTTLRCWPVDRSKTRLDEGVPAVSNA